MIEYKIYKPSTKDLILDVISTLVVNMIVIIMATKIFSNIYVENITFCYCF